MFSERQVSTGEVIRIGIASFRSPARKREKIETRCSVAGTGAVRPRRDGKRRGDDAVRRGGDAIAWWADAMTCGVVAPRSGAVRCRAGALRPRPERSVAGSGLRETARRSASQRQMNPQPAGSMRWDLGEVRCRAGALRSRPERLLAVSGLRETARRSAPQRRMNPEARRVDAMGSRGSAMSRWANAPRAGGTRKTAGNRGSRRMNAVSQRVNAPARSATAAPPSGAKDDKFSRVVCNLTMELFYDFLRVPQAARLRLGVMDMSDENLSPTYGAAAGCRLT